MKRPDFDRKRFSLLVLRDARMNAKTLVIAGFAVLGVVVLLSLLDTLKPPKPFFHRELFNGLLFAGGLLSTSLMFAEMHDKDRNHSWLMLPASNLEKFLSRLLYSSVGFAAVSVVLYFFSSTVSEGVNLLVAGRGHPLFNPFEGFVGMKCLNYLVIQSVFLFGGAFFRRHCFMKTLLSILAGGIVLTILLFVVLKTFYFDFGGSLNWSFELSGDLLTGGIGLEADRERLGLFSRIVKDVLTFAYWIVVAPLFWTLAFRRVRKVQVTHGV